MIAPGGCFSDTLEEERKMFAEAVHRQSLLMFDDLGIHVNMSTLPSAKLHAACRREKYGRGWLGRFWCRSVRPWLLPDDQAEIEELFEIAQQIQRVEFMNAIMEQGQQYGLTEARTFAEANQ